jgi:RNA-directed DNA polymerase
MKRQRIDLLDIAARDNLALAAYKAARGKRRHADVSDFFAQLEVSLQQLAEGILAGRVPLGNDRSFLIRDPKRRCITAPCFQDRVLHHAIFNLAEPRLDAALADSAFACRPGRGVHAAVQAVQAGLVRWPWLVQVDVEHYFDNVDHSVLLRQLERRFKGQDFMALLARIVCRGAAPARGLPIGALTSQHFANAYLDSADRLLSVQPGVGAVVRYMDDIVWFCDSRTQAQASLAVLRGHLLHDLQLRLKDRVVVRPSGLGLTFCGYRVRQGVVLAGPRKLGRYRQAAKRLARAEEQGVPQAGLQRAHDHALAALCPAASAGFRRRLWWPDGKAGSL